VNESSPPFLFGKFVCGGHRVGVLRMNCVMIDFHNRHHLHSALGYRLYIERENSAHQLQGVDS
jgi:hypothetical protein